MKAEDLRGHLSNRLPEYMVPVAFVRLEAWPLTPNGKLDRKVLPVAGSEAYATREYHAPEGEVEEKIAAIWKELLKVERVGRGDNFFELGGHSLQAVQLISRLRTALDVEVPIGDLFARPELAAFAGGLRGVASPQLPTIIKDKRPDRILQSYAQQRLWFLAQLEGGNAAYHIPAGLRVFGRLDRNALRRALDRIVQRHEALRTTFGQEEGEPVQRIGSVETSRFQLLEHRVEKEGELERWQAEEAGAPFDLERGPLVRGRLIQEAEDVHTLLITMHHIVSDGWSMGVFVNEFSALYTAYTNGEAEQLPDLEVQYADYAMWQRHWMAGELLQDQAKYWQRTLAGAPELLELPTDYPRPAQQSYAGGTVDFHLDETLTKDLRELSLRHGATLFMTMLAGWSALLSRLSNQSEVVIGTPTANRGRREVEGLIGYFLNTLVVRVDFAGAPTVAELLEQVKQRVVEAQSNQDIPFEQVVELVNPRRSLAYSPVFQVIFTWQSNDAGRLELPGISLEPLGDPTQAAAKFDLTFLLQEVNGHVAGKLIYATALFETETVERILGYYSTLLRGMVADE